MLKQWLQIFVSIAILACLTAPALANPHQYSQGDSKWYGAVTYNMAVPFGSTSDFSGDFSPRGVGLDVRYRFAHQWSAGMSFAWQGFDGKTTDPVTLKNATLQGTQFRYTNTVPLLVNSHYYLPDVVEWAIPFAGFGLGAYYMERRVDVGIYTVAKDTWHFGVAPELGVAFRVYSARPVLILRYNHAFSSEGSGDQSFLNINIGLGWN